MSTVHRAWLLALLVSSGLIGLLWIAGVRARDTVADRARHVRAIGAAPPGVEPAPLLRTQALRRFTLDPGYVRIPSGGTVETAAYSPDGRFLVTGSGDGVIALWGATNGTLRWIVNPLGRPVSSLAWSPNGRTLVGGVTGGGVLLLNARSGQVGRRLPSDPYHAPAAAYRPDGSLLAVASGNGGIDLWRGGATQRQARLRAPIATTAIGWSPDGRLLAAGAIDGTVIVWDVASSATRRAVLPAAGHGTAWDLQWSPTGTRLAVGYADGIVCIYAGTGLVPVRTLRAGGAVNTVAWSPDGSLLAVTAVGQPLGIWETSSGALVRRVRTGWDSNAVAWSPDGKALTLVTDGHDLVVWGVSPPSDAIGQLICHWLTGACTGLGGLPGSMPSYMGR